MRPMHPEPNSKPSLTTLYRLFTMTELMMVMIIIAVITVMILPAVVKSKQEARYGRWIGQTQSMRGDDALIILYDFEEKEGDVLTNKATGADLTDFLPTVLDGKRGAPSIAWDKGRWFTKGGLYFPPTIAFSPAGVEIESNRYLYTDEGSISIWARMDVAGDTETLSGTHFLYGSAPSSTDKPGYGFVGIYYEGSTLKAKIADIHISASEEAKGAGWHHYALTWRILDTGDGLATLYLDAKIVGSASFAPFEHFYPKAAVGAMMRSNPEAESLYDVTYSWLGYIDEFMYWNRELGDDEIRNIYKGGID